MSFALRWELGEEVPFEPNLLSFKHRKIKEQIEPYLIILMQQTSQPILFCPFFLIMFKLSQWNRSSPFYILKQIIMGLFKDTHQHLLTYQREKRDYDLLSPYHFPEHFEGFLLSCLEKLGLFFFLFSMKELSFFKSFLK